MDEKLLSFRCCMKKMKLLLLSLFFILNFAHASSKGLNHYHIGRLYEGDTTYCAPSLSLDVVMYFPEINKPLSTYVLYQIGQYNPIETGAYSNGHVDYNLTGLVPLHQHALTLYLQNLRLVWRTSTLTLDVLNLAAPAEYQHCVYISNPF